MAETEKLPWHHSCVGKPYCFGDWHVDHLEAPDDTNPRDLGALLADVWDVAELKMQLLGTARSPDRFVYLVYFRAKKKPSE